MKNSNHTHEYLRLISIVLASLTAVLGCIVLIGWYSHNETLIQVLPAFVPMQYNTALGFLLCGVALLALPLTGGRLSNWLGIIVSLIGILSLFEYIFGVNIGLDQLFMEHYITVETPYPGRMAANTAFCFTLSGIAMFFLAHPKHKKVSIPASGIMSSIIAALGAVAFFGYLSDVETAYGWGNLSNMAVHTAIGFIMLGTSFFLFAWRKAVEHGKVVPQWFPIPVGIGACTIALALWQALIAQEGTGAVIPGLVLGKGLSWPVSWPPSFGLPREHQFVPRHWNSPIWI